MPVSAVAPLYKPNRTGRMIATSEKSRSLSARADAIASPASGHTVTGIAEAMMNGRFGELFQRDALGVRTRLNGEQFFYNKTPLVLMFTSLYYQLLD